MSWTWLACSTRAVYVSRQRSVTKIIMSIIRCCERSHADFRLAPKAMLALAEDRRHLGHGCSTPRQSGSPGKPSCCAIPHGVRAESCHALVTSRARCQKTQCEKPGPLCEVHDIAMTTGNTLGHQRADCKSVGVSLPRFESWTCHRGQRAILGSSRFPSR
jgi:hypothetical protein